MPQNNKQYKPPSNWQDFEKFCHTLWGDILQDPHIMMNGRSGQEQHGVDIYGHNKEGIFTCIQCKGKDRNFGKEVTEKELIDEVNKAKNFEPIPDVFILATTAPNDAKIQKTARKLEQENKTKGLFKVKVYGWDEICQRLVHSPVTLKQFYEEEIISEQFSLLLGDKKEIYNKQKEKINEECIIDEDETTVAFNKSSEYLANWQQTLSVNDKWIEREQEEDWFDKIHSSLFSTTIILGDPGTGKSALLARITQKLLTNNKVVLGIKADKLSQDVTDFKSLGEALKLSVPIDICIRKLAETKPVYVIIDQLDALSALVDVKTSRLSVLLDLIQTLHNFENNIHIIASSHPIEFEHDLRLNSLEAEKIELPLLEWTSVTGVFSELNIELKYIDEEFKEFLKRPSNLNFYLQYIQKHEQEHFKSHLELYEHIWLNSLGKNDDFIRRTKLLISIASEMTEDAKQILPFSRFEVNMSDINYLCSAGVLVKDLERKNISFTHQTLQAFAWTRSFTKKATLSEFVISHQNNLNIRPKLNTVLFYLRDADPEEYKIQIQSLLIENYGSLRKHIIYLLIETIGTFPSPRNEEVLLISKLIQREELFLKVCQSIASQPDWFDKLKSSHIEYLMNGNEIQRNAVSIILASVIEARYSEVISLLNKYWKNSNCINHLFSVLRNNSTWESESLEIARFIILFDGIRDYVALDIISIISYSNPKQAPSLAAEYFNIQLNRLEKQPIEVTNEKTDDELLDWIDYKSKRKPFEEFAKLNREWYNLEEIGKAAPKEFIESFWAILDRLSNKLKIEYIGQKNRYYGVSGTWFQLKDDEDIGSNYLTETLEECIMLFATREPVDFIDFVSKTKNSLFTPQHQLISIGLTEIVTEYPNYVLDYLLEDERRFFLRGNFENSYKYSFKLVEALFPHLDDSNREKLEEKILSLEEYSSKNTDDLKNRRDYFEWNRDSRHDFLSILPVDKLSTRTYKIVKEENRRFGKKEKKDLVRRQISWSGARSPMSLKQVEAATINDIIKCFNEFKYENHIREFDIVSISELSRTLGELSKTNSKKARLIISKLSTEQSEAVEFVIRELPIEEVGMTELQKIINELISRGFNSVNFYQACARAIKKRIKSQNGLSDSWCEILESWMTENSYKPATIISSRKDEAQRKKSLIWYEGNFSVPQGNYTIIETISKGLLNRKDPEHKKWIDFIIRCLNYNDHVELWEFALVYLIRWYLPACKIHDVNHFMKTLHKSYPSIIESKEFGIVLAGSVHWIGDVLLDEWMEKIYNVSSDKSFQLFGEILCYGISLKSENERWQNIFREQFNNKKIEVLIGFAFSLVGQWEYIEYREVCSKYFVKLLSLKNEDIDEVLMRILYKKGNVDLSPPFQIVLDTFIKNATFERTKGRYISRTLSSLTNKIPEKIYEISQQIIKGAGQDLGDISKLASSVAPELVTVAITLHHMGPLFQHKGLDLFEQLIELNTIEAHEAIMKVDARPRIGLKRQVGRRRKC